MRLKNRLKIEARKTEIGMLETEILDLRGKTREQAMKTYRQLLSDSEEDMTYLARV